LRRPKRLLGGSGTVPGSISVSEKELNFVVILSLFLKIEINI
jgi:hypothetical protein